MKTQELIDINASQEACACCGVAPGLAHDEDCTGGSHRPVNRMLYLLEQSTHDEDSYAKVRALCEHLSCEPDDLSEESYQHYGELSIFSQGRDQYAIGTDEEADRAWDASLDSYIDECIMPEIKDKTLANYFDTEAWKRDARYDGRGHSLSSYDGCEDEVTVEDLDSGEDESEAKHEGGSFYIYRIN